MRKKYLMIIICLLFLHIPFNARAYDAVLTGTKETKSFGPIKSLTTGTSCMSSSPISCSIKRDKKEIRATCEGVCGMTGSTSSRACISCKRIRKSYYDNTYTFKLDREACGVATVNATSLGSKTIKYWHSWVSKSGTFGPYSDKKRNRETILDDQCRAYEGEKTVNINGRTYYTYTTFWSRCCGNSEPDAPEKKPACYRKVVDETKHIYDYKWSVSSPGKDYKEVTSIKTEKDCVIDNPEYCAPTNVQSSTTGNANKCADTVSIKLQDGNTCSVASSSEFYDIKCSDNIKVNFAPGFSSDTVTLKKGQGFNFDISLETIKTCTGVFNSSKWSDAYKKAVALVNRSQDAKEKKYYQNMLNEIITIVDTYNNWTIGSNADTSASARLSFEYKEKGQKKTYGVDYVTKSSKVTPGVKNVKNCKDLDNGKKVCDFTNYVIVSKKVLTPPGVLIDKATGEITVSKDNSIDGGNKIYTSLHSDTGTYKMSITVSNIGDNKQVTVKNDKCNIKIIDSNIQYRIIDVANPFLNNTLVGANWVNNTYDYSRVIKSDIWSQSKLYQFNLSSSEINSLKKSNSNDVNSYFGSCYKSQNLMDEITKKICGIIG